MQTKWFLILSKEVTKLSYCCAKINNSKAKVNNPATLSKPVSSPVRLTCLGLKGNNLSHLNIVWWWSFLYLDFYWLVFHNETTQWNWRMKQDLHPSWFKSLNFPQPAHGRSTTPSGSTPVRPLLSSNSSVGSFMSPLNWRVGDAVAWWLARWRGPVQALAGSLCCVLGQDTLLSHWVPLSAQEYKWVPANCQGNLTKCWGVTCNGLASHPGGLAILLVA